MVKKGIGDSRYPQAYFKAAQLAASRSTTLAYGKGPQEYLHMMDLQEAAASLDYYAALLELRCGHYSLGIGLDPEVLKKLQVSDPKGAALANLKR